MATTEELEKEILAEMAADPVAYAAGPVNDVITIDGETRVISVPASEILFGVKTDKDVERKHFRCPKIVGDNIDLSKHQIYISYITSDSTGKSFSGDSNLYLCEDVAIDGDDITFSWQLSGNVFASAGFIAFKVLAAKTDGENVQTRWNTVPAVGTVLMTVPDGMDISETYPDIVTQLLERMESVEKIATEEAMQGYVNTYLEAHPADIDETLTNPKKAAPADAVGKLKEDLVNESSRAKAEEKRIEELFSLPVEESVDKWLNEHPEVTTTVQDGSLLESKIHPDFLLYIKKDYVTPEMFGAVGDGVTDDTEAFEKCVQANKPIICGFSKKYKFSRKLVVLTNKFYFDGNYSEFVDFQMDYFTKDGGHTWLEKYEYLEAIIKNCIFTDQSNLDYCIMDCGALKLYNIGILNYTKFLSTGYGEFYLDYFYATNVTHGVYTNDDYITFDFSNGYGDKYIIERSHFVKVKAHARQPITLNHCLNGGISGSNSQFILQDCHFETFSYSDISHCKITFNNCYFFSSITLPTDAVYKNCVFMNDKMCVNTSNDFWKLNTSNCDIYVQPNGTIGYEQLIKLDSLKNNTCIMEWTGGKCVTYNSKGGDIEFNDKTATYEYAFYKSTSKDFICNCDNVEKSIVQIALENKGATPLFTSSINYMQNGFIHIYRTNKNDNTIKYVCIPAVYLIRDMGSCINGFLWKSVDTIPDFPESLYLNLVNGIYEGNSENVKKFYGKGLILNSETGVLKLIK